MTAPVLVTGGTGTLGRLVVARLRDAGRDVRVLSRHHHATGGGIEYVTGDLETGEGVEAAAAGLTTVVHCAGSQLGDGEKTRTLIGALARSTHLVYISVVGADRVPQVGRADRTMFGYFGSKLDGERVVAGSGLPYTTLRATQFHDLVLMAAEQMARLPIVPVPAGFRVQPVDADDVAARLTELALGRPAGLVAEMGGPRVYGMAHLIRGYLRAVGRNRPVVPVGLPGRAARALRDGANLAPGP
ncbi:MAG: NAD(P)H-binding protein, partial [Actinocatenispora sp.]